MKHTLCIHVSVHQAHFHNPDTRCPDHSSGSKASHRSHMHQYKLAVPLSPVHSGVKTDFQTQNRVPVTPDHPAVNPIDLQHINSSTAGPLLRYSHHRREAS